MIFDPFTCIIIFLFLSCLLGCKKRDCHDVLSVSQLATLKAALARKEVDPDHYQNTVLSPEVHRMKAGGPSSIHSDQQGGDVLVGQSNHREPMQYVGNTEVIIVSIMDYVLK